MGGGEKKEKERKGRDVDCRLQKKVGARENPQKEARH